MSHKLIVTTLKQILKSKKIHYKHLSSEIGMSESGLKKLLTANDISLGRLNQIADVVGISLSEILRVAEEKEIKSISLTPKQEDALLKDHQLFRLFWFLTVEEKTIESLIFSEKISSEKIKKYLLKLENLDLIKVSKAGRITSAHKGLYRWTSEGPFLKKLNKEWSEETLRKVLANPTSEANLHRLSYLKLSPEAKENFYADMNDLINEYARRSAREKTELANDKLVPVSALIALSETAFLS